MADSNIGALRPTLERIPGGTDAIRTMKRLGLWTSSAHTDPAERKAFPKRISDLGPDELSDLQAYTVSEAGRIFELLGVLNGLDAQMKIRDKQVRAAARTRVRNSWPADTKAPTKTEIDDLAADDPAVLELEEQHSLLVSLLAQVTAVKEATILYKEAVSREITWRGSQMQARLY